jgi:hypothetical protein
VATFDARTPRLRGLHTATSRVQPMDFEHCTMDVNYGHVLHADVEVETVDAPTRKLGALATSPQSIEQGDVNFGAVATSSSRSRCTTIEVAMYNHRGRDVQPSRSRCATVERAACKRRGRLVGASNGRRARAPHLRAPGYVACNAATSSHRGSPRRSAKTPLACSSLRGAVRKEGSDEPRPR